MSELPAVSADVVVVGHGATLWLAALALERAMGPTGSSVLVVQLPAASEPGRALSALPPLRALHDKLGVDEAALLRATGGSFSHGQAFVGRGVAWESFFHPWSVTGAPLLGQPFFPCWLRGNERLWEAGGWSRGRLEDYCLAAVAARRGRVLVSQADPHGATPDHAGLHVDAHAYAEFLRGIAMSRRIQVLAARALEPLVEAARITALRLDDGAAVVQGRLYVDATGPAALLMGRALGVGQQPATEWGPSRRITHARAPVFRSIPPLSEVRVSEHGYTLLHPTRALTSVVHVSADEPADEWALAQTVSGIAGAVVQDVRSSVLQPQARVRSWHGNCVALGEANVRFDPLHDVELLVVHLGLAHLLTLLPEMDGAAHDAERAEYNRVMDSALARIRDFQRAFHARTPLESGFWRAQRDSPLPPQLEARLGLFGARGEYAPAEDDYFGAEGWQSLLTGLGMQPTSWRPEADAADLHKLRASLDQQRADIRSAVNRLRPHDQVLKELG